MKCKLCDKEIEDNIFLRAMTKCQSCVNFEVAARKKNQIKVIAIDSKGNQFEKIVEILISPLDLSVGSERIARKIISFGWPCEYNFEDWLKNYPFKKDICIDMSGRNHWGYPDVCIKKEDMNEIIDIFLTKEKNDKKNN